MIGESCRQLVRHFKIGSGLIKLWRSPLDPAYRDILKKYLLNREENFLGIARTILASPAHPYAQLFQIAGCSYADLEAGVRRDGLEPTLEALLHAGVYLSLDEFRCKTEIVRGGRHIPASMPDWDLARARHVMESTSSGTSGGTGMRTGYTLEASNFGMAGGRLLLDELVLTDDDGVVFAPILPSTMGFGTALGGVRLGHRVEKWFAFGGSMRGNGHYRVLTKAIVAAVRASGAKIPYPTYLDRDDFTQAAIHIARRKKEGVRTGIFGMVSSVARLASAACDAGVDIRGTRALVTGETLTSAKRGLIESAGIEVFPIYATTDFGGIGNACRSMGSGDSVHITKTAVALVGRPIDNPWDDGQLNSLHVTSLLPFAPRALINVEMGDTGVIEPATCDCEFSRMGYDMTVRNISAIGKLTTQGCTIYTRELVRILEEDLPQKYGGRPGDFQLVEREGRAQTELVLRIHPRLKIASVDDVLQFFIARFSKAYGGALAKVQWNGTNGIRAEVAEPVLASSGKFRAIRPLATSSRPSLAVPEVGHPTRSVASESI